MELEFNNLPALHWLWLVAALAVVALASVAWRVRAMRRFVEADLVSRVTRGFSTPRLLLRSAMVVGAMALLVGALTDPRWGSQTEEVRRKGADMMFVVDVSRSMLAEDATPSRLGRAKGFIEGAIGQMAGDRVGLVDFAGVAALRTPLTLNYGALMSSVDGLEPKDSLRGGSMLGDAIRTAAESFSSDATAGRAIVVLSDGEDMGSDPVAAAKEVFEKQGIRIITVGIGDSRDGGRIPVDRGGERTWQLHDGQEVWTRMDPDTLGDVASAGGGVFVPAGTAQVDLGEILSRSLGDLERQDFEVSTIRRTIPRFQWPAGAALLLLVVECLIPDRKAIKPLPAGGAA